MLLLLLWWRLLCLVTRLVTVVAGLARVVPVARLLTGRLTSVVVGSLVLILQNKLRMIIRDANYILNMYMFKYTISPKQKYHHVIHINHTRF